MMESTCGNTFENSPLNLEEISLIASTKLSATEKHHLRMLAHCLKCFQAMSTGSEGRLIPSKEVWLEWCLTNPVMVKDDEFVQVLFDQFSGAAVQLEKLATVLQVAPLDLTLDNLIAALKS